jgi:hypothetical protein
VHSCDSCNIGCSLLVMLTVDTVHAERFDLLRTCLEPNWRGFGSSKAAAAADLVLLAERLGYRNMPARRRPGSRLPQPAVVTNLPPEQRIPPQHQPTQTTFSIGQTAAASACRRWRRCGWLLLMECRSQRQCCHVTPPAKGDPLQPAAAATRATAGSD